MPPKSVWDKYNAALRPFTWATPAAVNVRGEEVVPEPWRVAKIDQALKWLRQMFPENRDLYTDHEADLWRGRLLIWVGLRDNRDAEAHAERLGVMFEALKQARLPVRPVTGQGRLVALHLVDDLEKDVLRQKGASEIRSLTLRLAATLPRGSKERRALLKAIVGHLNDSVG